MVEKPSVLSARGAASARMRAWRSRKRPISGGLYPMAFCCPVVPDDKMMR